jgi:hypothetical protein
MGRRVIREGLGLRLQRCADQCARMRWVIRMLWGAALAASFPLGLSTCGGRANVVNAGGDIDAVIAAQTEGGSTAADVACNDLFAAATPYGCGGPSLPASEMTRLNVRFRQACENALALPGTGLTLQALETCSAALNASSCQVVANSDGTILIANGGLAACDFRGSLPGGATCNEGIQCVSGECLGARGVTPGGSIAPRCGTCAPAVDVGEPCAPTDGCVPGAVCTYGASNSVVCVAITYGELGTECDNKTSLCGPGLFCNQQMQCASLPASVGDSCTDFTGCARPLTCVGLGVPQKCKQPESAGTSCSVDQDCATGLGCVSSACVGQGPGSSCPSSAACTPVAWAMPGQPCDETSECLVASCLSTNGVGPPSPNAAPPPQTCPSVTPDGQPCGNGTCDTYSVCFKGICTPTDSVVCK